MRPSTRQCRFRQPSQITYRLNQLWSSITAANSVWVFESQANKMTETWVHKIWTFWWCWICIDYPTKWVVHIKTRNSFPPEDIETIMWSTATCSPNFELSGKSDSGSGTRWLRILFENNLARLQMSHLRDALGHDWSDVQLKQLRLSHGQLHLKASEEVHLEQLP